MSSLEGQVQERPRYCGRIEEKMGKDGIGGKETQEIRDYKKGVLFKEERREKKNDEFRSQAD